VTGAIEQGLRSVKANLHADRFASRTLREVWQP
jgi:hypothetical protein